MIRAMMFGAFIAACWGTVCAQSAEAQDDAQTEIVVTGVRPERLQEFVEQIAAVPPSVDQIARWDDDICLSVLGLGEEQGQFVVDQVSYRAQGVGLSAGGSGCAPNVFVFFAADAEAFSRRLVEERKSLFAYYHEEHIATLGQAALTDFMETARPVRWWHVVQTRGADGQRLGSDNAGQSAPPPPRDGETRPDADGITGAQAVRSQGSRIRAAERQDFNRVIIIVDGQRASGYTLEAIADYIAMVTLAQIDPNAEVGTYPTVLNLFAADQQTAGMTDWDLAYLSGLYRTIRNAANANQQMRDISRRMAGAER